MILDITGVQFATIVDTFKNYPSVTGTISVPAQSYTAGQYRKHSANISLDKVDATTQVLFNFSFNSSRYYTGFVQENPDSNFIAQPRVSVNGNDLLVDCYVTNQTGSTQNLSAFTLTIEVRRFIAPFV